MDNINEMLSSNTINELYEQYVNFNNFICPYLGEQKENFISQTFSIIYYFPIPFKNIAGFTYKKYGLIFISNINRYDKITTNKNKEIETELCRQINKMSFLKVVHVHEIICNYSCTIIHANDKEISISTPEKNFYKF